MQVLNAMDLKAGKKAKQSKMYNVTQPLQFISAKDKDQDWAANNLDWLEWNGLKQIRANARRLLKNYKLAEGIIDKTDYIVEEDNEMQDVVQQLASDDELSALELKFYPIIPNVINTLSSEFAKRNKRVTFRAVDEYTYNEILEKKKGDIESVLIQHAEAKLVERMIEQGLDPDSEEGQQMLQENTSPDVMKTLPEIQDFYNKDYEVIAEKWASKQHVIDEERFKMDELEELAFKDKLITDREFWHFNMYEDDYAVELWNPVLTFYHKSPTERYTSNGQHVGKSEMMTVSDVIDKFGWLMNQEQLESMQFNHPIHAAGYTIGGQQNDGSYYDPTRSHKWNVGSPSLAYRQYTSFMENFVYNGNDIVEFVLGESEDYKSHETTGMLRVTQAYWKSQMKVGYLTKIDDLGRVSTEIITEDYQVTDKPVYNTSLIKNKTTQNLVFGEHIEWIWINQTWGGIKIGPNHPTYLGMEKGNGFDPIYLGINQNRIKPLKFQFKGDNNLYGCKLPVEGRVFSDRNTRSTSLVDRMKPFQIGYNIVNNQISDILIDEIGTVILLDQNALPKHSLGEDWGKGNLAKAYVAMKDFSMLPLDTSISNTENALNFQHFQQLDLSQTNRLMSRVQLANFFKSQAFEQVGLSTPRMGQQIGQTLTATEVEQIQVGSYAQTENHFIEHSDHLMPRVHKMRTDLAQYYQSTKSSVRLQTSTTLDERVNFEINGKELMLRDINVFCSAKANHRAIIEQMQQIAINNNTMGASIYDLGQIMQTDSMGGLNSALKKAEEKAKAEAQEKMAHEQKLAEEETKRAEIEKRMELDHEAVENEKDRRKDLLVAEIRASGFGAMQDINQNQQSDFIDNMQKIKQTEAYQEQTDIQREKLSNDKRNNTEKMALEREKMAHAERLKDKDVQIAKENKNQYDVPKKTSDKDKKKKS